METTVKVKKAKGPFELKMQFFGLPLALFLFAVLYTMPTPAGLSYAGKMALAVFTAALVLWISESLPNYAVSLLVIVALPLTGAWSESKAMEVLDMKSSGSPSPPLSSPPAWRRGDWLGEWPSFSSASSARASTASCCF